MTSFSPIVTTDQLGTYLKDSTLDTERAALLIEMAQIQCARIVSPLPENAWVIVLQVAARAYVTITQARYAQAQGAGMPFGANPAATGEVRLFPSDIQALREMADGGGAFSIDLLPVGFVAPPSPFSTAAGFDTIP